ncbi:MAG: ATP-binding protein [Betaproteobacteria bacterium]|nr:ATP-binding protein [Betaproteobacteria bacterium]
MKYLVLAGFIAVASLIYVLSSASANTDFFARDFPWLLGATAALSLAMLSLLSYQIWQLHRRIRAGQFGAKLTVKLLLVFGLMALLPGAVVYTVSVQFLSRSIESWFDVKVDRALESGLNLGQTTLDTLQHDLNDKADAMALHLAELPGNKQASELNSLRDLYGVQEAALYGEGGRLLAISGGRRFLPPTPDQRILAQVRQQHPYSRVETMGDQGLVVRVMVPVNLLSLTETIPVLQLLQPVPAKLADDAQAVQLAYQDYQSLSLSRLGLKRLYGMTLTLTMVLTLLTTGALAFLISEQIAAPLRALAKGTRAVAQGDFSQMHPVSSRDELGMLTLSFNRMTRQLADARNVAEDRRAQIEKSFAYLEAVLAHLTSGVITFDEHMRVRSINPSAEQILQVQAHHLQGKKIYQWGIAAPHLSELAEALIFQFKQTPSGEWQQQLGFNHAVHGRVLLVHGTKLPSSMEGGSVLVFDDITDLLRVQRDAAWGEVARRLAHEIKNPLTPIQLSAERIEHKLAGKLLPQDAEALHRSTQTIVQQVSAMKAMVNAFAEYARPLNAHLLPVDLNGLIRDVLELYNGEKSIRLELGEPLPQIMGDEKLLRQVIHNLLQNAQDAVTDVAEPLIHVSTTFSQSEVLLTISDNGTGLSEQVRERLFEPYATTKSKGTGLGLAIVKKIIEEHHGTISLDNVPQGGVMVCIRLRVVDRDGLAS